MTRFAIAMVVGVLLTLFAECASAEGRRVALVIGVSAYQNVAKLPNPANDASAVAAMFRNAGFDVVSAHNDINYLDFKRAIRAFQSAVSGADIAVIFYAGHGIEINDKNYLLPVDASLLDERDVEDEAITLDRLIASLEGASQLRLVILDACRDNPFASRMNRRVATRAMASGLGRVDPQQNDPSANLLIAFAAKAKSVAHDGGGSHSPFTTALLANLTAPGLDIRLAFGRVRDDVLRATDSRQEPFVYGSLGGGNIALVPARREAVTPALMANTRNSDDLAKAEAERNRLEAEAARQREEAEKAKAAEAARARAEAMAAAKQQEAEERARAAEAAARRQEEEEAAHLAEIAQRRKTAEERTAALAAERAKIEAEIAVRKREADEAAHAMAVANATREAKDKARLQALKDQQREGAEKAAVAARADEEGARVKAAKTVARQREAEERRRAVEAEHAKAEAEMRAQDRVGDRAKLEDAKRRKAAAAEIQRRRAQAAAAAAAELKAERIAAAKRREAVEERRREVEEAAAAARRKAEIAARRSADRQAEQAAAAAERRRHAAAAREAARTANVARPRPATMHDEAPPYASASRSSEGGGASMMGIMSPLRMLPFFGSN